MNRVRKYRVWKKQRDGTFKMDYEPFVYDGECLGEFSMVNINKALANGGNAEYPESNIFMDFIGLCDKNGKDIYEGDLIKHSGYIYKIIFNNCGFTAINTDSKTAVPAECEFLNNIELEVIGNIYENPDLIKGGDK